MMVVEQVRSTSIHGQSTKYSVLSLPDAGLNAYEYNARLSPGTWRVKRVEEMRGHASMFKPSLGPVKSRYML